jgi:hypothetical protein
MFYVEGAIEFDTLISAYTLAPREPAWVTCRYSVVRVGFSILLPLESITAFFAAKRSSARFNNQRTLWAVSFRLTL